MKKFGLIFSLLMATRLVADTRIIPIDDGSIYGLAPSPNSVSRDAYVMASTYIRGAMLFASFDSSINSNFYLALNPYALPIWDSTVDVYGYGSSSSAILPTDYDKGVLLGTITIPSPVRYGQDTFFDVTSFIRGSNTPYFGFILRADSGTDVFSSLEYNLGNPSRIVGVPEVASWEVFLGLASVFLAAAFVKRNSPALEKVG